MSDNATATMQDDTTTTDGDSRTVEQAIRDEMNGEIQAATVGQIVESESATGEPTVYLTVVRHAEMGDLTGNVQHTAPVVDVRTVIVDLASETVTVSDNGLWVRSNGRGLDALQRVLAASRQPDFATVESESGDPDLVLNRTVSADAEYAQDRSRMKSVNGISPSRSWGFGGGAPPEVETTAERIRDAGGNPADHMSRLRWGRKDPMDRQARPVSELTGNYGVEIQARASGLIGVDIDDPSETTPRLDGLHTFEVSSPHGSDEQKHAYLWCNQKRRVAEELGGWAIQGVSWGDLWIGDRYLVGAGSQLGEFGCTAGDHEPEQPGGCRECESETGGFYEVINDQPIQTVSADWVLAMVKKSDGWQIHRSANSPEQPEGNADDVIQCDSCGAWIHEEASKSAGAITICAGGCQ